MYPELTYADYQTAGGTAAEEDFNARILAARAYLNHLIWPREVTTEAQKQAYKNALVASINAGEIAEVAITSKRVGNTSVTFSDAASGSSPAMNAARNALVGSGLLFKGL